MAWLKFYEIYLLTKNDYWRILDSCRVYELFINICNCQLTFKKGGKTMMNINLLNAHGAFRTTDNYIADSMMKLPPSLCVYINPVCFDLPAPI